MSDHQFDPLSQLCRGCDVAASTIANLNPLAGGSRGKAAILAGRCPAEYTIINDGKMGMLSVVSAPDRLVISGSGGELLRLDSEAKRALIYAAGGSC